MALVSGGASTFCNAFRQTLNGGDLHWTWKFIGLIANRPDCPGIQNARKAGYTGPVSICDERRPDFLQRLLEAFAVAQPDWYFQLGWVPQTPKEIMEKCRGANQHPAPTPWMGGQGFYGLTPHVGMRVLAAQLLPQKQIFTEATLQLVHQHYDLGRSLSVSRLVVDPALSAEEIQKLLLPFEHRNVVAGMNRIAEHRGEIPPPVESSLVLDGVRELSALRAARRAALIATNRKVPEVEDPNFRLPWAV